MDKELDINKLNPKQKLFCEVYSNSGNFFGNATRAYIVAYGLDIPADVEYSALNAEQRKIYDSASAMSVALLRNIRVIKKCNEILDKLIENEIVDRELAYTIMQRDELSPKVSAIKEYNQLKGRIKQSPLMAIQININPEEKAKIDKALDEII